MREICTSGSMRGDWKHALLARNGLLRWINYGKMSLVPVVRQSSTLQRPQILVSRRHFN